jgi:hypothetical protein
MEVTEIPAAMAAVTAAGTTMALVTAMAAEEAEEGASARQPSDLSRIRASRPDRHATPEPDFPGQGGRRRLHDPAIVRRRQ